MILKWILKIGLGRRGRNFYGSGQEKVLNSCERNKKISCSVKCGAFLDWETVSFKGGMCSLKLTYGKEIFSKLIFWIRIKVSFLCSVFSVSYGFRLNYVTRG
jgi:hypothetical protein